MKDGSHRCNVKTVSKIASVIGVRMLQLIDSEDFNEDCLYSESVENTNEEAKNLVVTNTKKQ